MKNWFETRGYWMRIPLMINLGMLFIVAGVGKIFYSSNSYTVAPFLETLPGFSWFYSVLPYLEIAIGLLLVAGLLVRYAAISAGIMVAVFAASSIYLVSIGQGSELCGCFGMAGNLNFKGALIIDTVMALMVAGILLCQKGGKYNYTPWFLDDTKIIAKQRA